MDTLNSEGITFKRPAKWAKINSKETKGSRKRKSEDDDSDSDSDYEPEYESCENDRLDQDVLRTFEGPQETIHRRQKLYADCLKNLKDIYESVQNKFNEELKTGFSKFMDFSLRLLSDNDGTLPVGIVESGLSTKENSALFDFLEDELKKRIVPHKTSERMLITRIDSSSATSTKAIFQKMCTQLINSIIPTRECSSSSEVSDSDDEIQNNQKRGGKNVHYSLYDVKSRLNAEKDANFRIVVLVEDAEYFSILTISQLLALMGCANLPVIFVFGATHGHFVNNIIPSNSPSQFVIQKFYSVSTQERLDDFMRRFIFNKLSPFKISGEIVAFLESLYREENFSIQHIFNSLAICLRYHFLKAKSTFCSWEQSNKYSDAAKNSLLEKLLSENFEKSPRKRIKLIANDMDVNAFIDTSLENQNNWLLVFRVLCRINSRLAELPLGESYCEIYASCCKGMKALEVSDTSDPFENFFRAIKATSKGTFHEILDDCAYFLKNNLPNIKLKNQLITEFQELLNAMEEKENREQTTEKNTPTSQRLQRVRIPKTNSLKEVQKIIMQAKSETMSALLTGKTKFVESLKQLMKTHFPPLTSLQFSQAFVFTDLNLLVNTISPANFLKLDEDLKIPGVFLQCECCSSLDSTAVDINLPDVSILHKLISEHTTKKVDLNLVYRSFLGIVEADPNLKRRRSKINKDAAEASYLLRFRRGVGELQHMGFLKRSKSKPDEITKLTWW